MQETFLLQARIPGAARQASELGFFSSFVPARGTTGRPMAILPVTSRLLRRIPIDLVHGATVHRPLSDEATTSPVTHGETQQTTKIDWFLVSKSLLPATGLEEAPDFKPDHNMVQIQVDLEKVSQSRISWSARLRNPKVPN
eukprot:5567990-Amphidinium_carterae.5